MDEEKEGLFGQNEEAAIISLCLDEPEFFHSVVQHLGHEHFQRPEVAFLFAVMQKTHEKMEVVPSRAILDDIVREKLTVDDEYAPVLELLHRESDPREVPLIKQKIIDWCRDKAYALLYGEDAVSAYQNHDYHILDEIVEKAQRVVDVSQQGLWFFEQIELLFRDDSDERFASGFTRLDRYLNDGGPIVGDVLCWMAPTGVGKSIIMVNSGVANLLLRKKVLHITLELSQEKTQQRYMGAMTEHHIADRISQRNAIKKKILNFQESITTEQNSGDLVIYEFPPDEISVDTIYQLVDWLRKHKRWGPDVIIVDYLDHMLSRRHYNNKEDYVRQKQIAVELRGMAKNTKTFVITATQTNRSGTDVENSCASGGEAKNIDLNKVSESFGKTMPLDYIISMNQSKQEYDKGRIRLYIVKNRNGKKFMTIDTEVNYGTMKMRQLDYRESLIDTDQLDKDDKK